MRKTLIFDKCSVIAEYRFNEMFSVNSLRRARSCSLTWSGDC